MASDRFTLRGELTELRRMKSDGWSIGRMRVEGERSELALTGHLAGSGVRKGDAIEVVGAYTQHPKYGRQFTVESIVVGQPLTLAGVIAWLAATLPNVGPSRARELVQVFGGVEGLWRVIEHSPHRLSDVAGITPPMAIAIHAAYQVERADRDTKIALRELGLTDKQVERCRETWQLKHAGVLLRIRNNPYVLAAEVSGFGFVRADEVARKAGIAHNAPERIEAGLVFLLSRAYDEGHLYMWGGQLQRQAAETLGVSPGEAGDGIVRAWRGNVLIRRGARVYARFMETLEQRASLALKRVRIGSYSETREAAPTLH